jgi:hypothetical protein
MTQIAICADLDARLSNDRESTGKEGGRSSQILIVVEIVHQGEGYCSPLSSVTKSAKLSSSSQGAPLREHAQSDDRKMKRADQRRCRRFRSRRWQAQIMTPLACLPVPVGPQTASESPRWIRWIRYGGKNERGRRSTSTTFTYSNTFTAANVSKQRLSPTEVVKHISHYTGTLDCMRH